MWQHKTWFFKNQSKYQKNKKKPLCGSSSDEILSKTLEYHADDMISYKFSSKLCLFYVVLRFLSKSMWNQWFWHELHRHLMKTYEIQWFWTKSYRFWVPRAISISMWTCVSLFDTYSHSVYIFSDTETYDLLHHDALSHQVTWTLRKTQNKALSRQASVKPKGLEPSSTWYMHMQAKTYAYVMMINHRQTSIECRLEFLTHPLGEQKETK